MTLSIRMDNHLDTQFYTIVRQQTLNLCQPLFIEDYVVQPAQEVSPPKWHLAHTTWFFEHFILKKFTNNYQPFDPLFDELFNSYYKSISAHWLQAKRGFLSRPSVEHILAYRAHVDTNMRSLLDSFPAEEVYTLTELGIHHEQQHQELLLMDIKYILGTNLSLPAYIEKPLPIPVANSLGWIPIEEGLYPIGSSTEQFAYDHERPIHQFYQHSSMVADRLVTNEEFMQFIDDDGYANPLLWLSDGWNWLQNNQRSNPLYWHRRDGTWFEYTLHGNQLLGKTLPVCHINYYEAYAFAEWCGARLPTEQELEIYLTNHQDNKNCETDSYFHPARLESNQKQLWAWTRSPYSAYPGHKILPGALGEYNGKFMCNQQVLRGGCFATPALHYRHGYRNFYFPSQQWMFSGICLAKDA